VPLARAMLAPPSSPSPLPVGPLRASLAGRRPITSRAPYCCVPRIKRVIGRFCFNSYVLYECFETSLYDQDCENIFSVLFNCAVTLSAFEIIMLSGIEGEKKEIKIERKCRREIQYFFFQENGFCSRYSEYGLGKPEIPKLTECLVFIRGPPINLLKNLNRK